MLTAKSSLLIDASGVRGQVTHSRSFSVGKICQVSIFFYVFKDQISKGTLFLFSGGGAASVCVAVRKVTYSQR